MDASVNGYTSDVLLSTVKASILAQHNQIDI